MALEIERKFLLANEGWRGLAEGIDYRQGYLCADRQRTVRVRIAGQKGYLTVKGATTGLARSEYEYDIPLKDALAMLDTLCPQPQIEKKTVHHPLARFHLGSGRIFRIESRARSGGNRTAAGRSSL